MRKELKLSSADCRAAAAGLSTTAGGVERGAGSPWRWRVPRSPRQRGALPADKRQKALYFSLALRLRSRALRYLAPPRDERARASGTSEGDPETPPAGNPR